MWKKILLILITSITITSLTGCSLFSSDSEEQETAVSEDGEEQVEGSTEEVVSDEAPVVADSDEEEVVDEYPDDDYGDDDKVAVTESSSSDLPDQPLEENKEETLYVDGAANESTQVADTAPVQDSLTEPMPKATIEVKKMKKTPYEVGGVLINRLYIARDGDTMKSVAEKVYGDSSRSSDLLTWNPHFRGKGLSVGDKVYYNSARNPTDNSQILLYYEEAGLQPSYYTTKNGESIREVSQQLLGHPRSWIEIWAINDVESKWAVAQVTQLRYWPAGTVAAPVQAAAPVETAPQQPEEEVISEESAPAETAAMSEEEMPTDDMGAAASMAQNEEPPPPPAEAAPPPPPPPPEAIPTPEAPADGGLASMMNGEGGDSMTMAILGGLLILAALILLVFIRRGRKKAYG